jgi:hypothetical protein
MLQVKIFDEEHESDLEEKVNQFLSGQKEEDIRNIDYQVQAMSSGDEQVYCFTVMIVYKRSNEV